MQPSDSMQELPWFFDKSPLPSFSFVLLVALKVGNEPAGKASQLWCTTGLVMVMMPIANFDLSGG